MSVSQNIFLDTTVAWDVMNSIMFFTNGRNWLRCCDGPSNKVWYVNPFEPTQVIAAASASGAGSLTPTYQYRVAGAYVHDVLGYMTSPGSTWSNIATIEASPADTLNLTNIPTAEASADHLNIDRGYEDGFNRTVIFRNINGSMGALVGNTAHMPYYKDLVLQPTDTTGSCLQVDESLDWGDPMAGVVNRGALPPPVQRYIRKSNDRMLLAGFEKYIPTTGASNLGQVYMTSGSDECTMTAATMNALPDGFTNYAAPNLAMVVDDTDAGVNNGERFGIRFKYTGGVASFVLDRDWVHAGGAAYYDFYIEEWEPNSVYYSQRNSPFYWGDKINGSHLVTKAILEPTDRIIGLGSSGSLALVCGRGSTCCMLDLGNSIDTALWIKSTISGGVLSHWSIRDCGSKGVFALGDEGPMRFQRSSKEQAEGGYFGEWLPMDLSQTGHRRLAKIFMNEIDKSKPERIQSGYIGGDIVEWSFSTKDGTIDNDLQLRYNVVTDSYTLHDHRQKMCYAMYEDANSDRYLMHGDGIGGIHADDICDIDGDFSTIDGGDGNDNTAVYSGYWGAPDDFTRAQGDGEAAFPTTNLGLAGCRCYAVSSSIANPDNYRIVESNTDKVLTFRSDTAWTGSDPDDILVCGRFSYIDTRDVPNTKGGSRKIVTNVHLERLTTANGELRIHGYEKGIGRNVTDGATQDVPSTSGSNTKEIHSLRGLGVADNKVNIRLSMLSEDPQTAIKMVEVSSGQTKDSH